MDINQSIRIVECLANGTHPLTGEVIPADAPYNNPEIIRALYTCVEELKYPTKKTKKTTSERNADNLKKGLPKNAGMPWTDEFKSRLAKEHQAGFSPADLANKFERTKYSILLELEKQGLITDQEVTVQ